MISREFPLRFEISLFKKIDNVDANIFNCLKTCIDFIDAYYFYSFEDAPGLDDKLVYDLLESGINGIDQELRKRYPTGFDDENQHIYSIYIKKFTIFNSIQMKMKSVIVKMQ